MKKSLLILLIIFQLIAFASIEDSLKNRLNNPENNVEKLKYYNELFFHYYQTGNIKNALELSYRILDFSESSKQVLSGMFYQYLGDIYSRFQQADSAIIFFEESCIQFKKEEDLDNYWYVKANIAYQNYTLANYSEALELLVEILKYAENDANPNVLRNAHMVFGFVYRGLGDFDKALENMKLFLEYSIESKDDYYTCAAYNEIANVLNLQKKYEEALDYHLKALAMSETFAGDINKAYIYNDIAGDYHYMGQTDKAMEYYYKALDIGKIYDNYLIQIVTSNNIASIYYDKMQYKEAIELFHESMVTALKTNLKQYVSSNCESLSLCYDLLGDYKNAYQYYKLFKAYEDSVFTDEKSLKIEELNKQYETVKKDRDIKLLEKDKLLSRERERKKDEFIMFVIIGGAVILGFLILVFIQFLQKKRANKLLKNQNEEIKIQKEEITDKNEELLQQQEEIRAINEQLNTAFNELSIKNKEIIQSIEYAESIQKAILPDKEFLDKILGDYFVLFRPKDIIGGDFYWTAIKDEKLFFVVADCTGHGVPGALMSMLGISLLNEIVSEHSIFQPNEILDLLREKIIETLKQGDLSAKPLESSNLIGSKDGMDLSLVIIDKKNRVLQFSGANNSIFVITKNKNEISGLPEEKANLFNGEELSLIEIKPDKMPVGVHINQSVKFSGINYRYNSGDIIYLFSDGYADQFGGVKKGPGKKFLYRRFRETLIDTAKLPLNEQRVFLEETFVNWMGNHKQVDDVLLVGIKLD